MLLEKTIIVLFQPCTFAVSSINMADLHNNMSFEIERNIYPFNIPNTAFQLWAITFNQGCPQLISTSFEHASNEVPYRPPMMHLSLEIIKISSI